MISRDVLPSCPAEAGAAARDVREDPLPAPIELEAVTLLMLRQSSTLDRAHRLKQIRQRLPAFDSGIHPVDHPVVSVGLEQHVPAGDPAAGQHELHLAVGPFLCRVGPAIPDLDAAAAVLAPGNLAAGQSRTGWLAFELAEKADTLLLVYRFFGTTLFSVDLY